MKSVLRLAPLALIGFAAAACAQTTLSGNEWRITAIGTERPTSEQPLTLQFEDGRVSGYSGCNRVMGTVTQDGTKLSFSQMASTMMACPDEQMKLERSYVDALSKVDQFAITPGGALELMGPDGVLLRAVR